MCFSECFFVTFPISIPHIWYSSTHTHTYTSARAREDVYSHMEIYWDACNESKLNKLPEMQARLVRIFDALQINCISNAVHCTSPHCFGQLYSISLISASYLRKHSQFHRVDCYWRQWRAICKFVQTRLKTSKTINRTISTMSWEDAHSKGINTRTQISHWAENGFANTRRQRETFLIHSAPNPRQKHCKQLLPFGR